MTNPFTPEQISQILEEFFKVVGTRQYIGARYVPIFGRKGEESIEWDNSAPYEPLTIVLYQGNSYTSRQYVPVGVEITNQEFWAITGNYNAQVEMYRQEVRNLLPYDETPTEDSTKAVTSDGIKKAIDTAVSVETTRAKEAEQVNATAISDETTRAKEAEAVIDELLPKNAFSSKHTVYDEITAKVAKKQVFNPIINLYPSMQIETPADRVTQGGCIAGDSIIFGAYYDNTKLNPAYVYDVKLQTGNIVNQNTNNSFGHCNDMTYNSKNNTIVIAGADNGSKPYPIYVLDRNTLTVSNEITPSVNISSICYNPDDDVYYGIGFNALYTFNSNFEVIETATVDTENYTFQGIAYHNGYIFNLNSTTDSVDIFDTNGNIYKSIPINYDSSIAELEFCDFYNNVLYIGIAAIYEPFMMLYQSAIANVNTKKYKYNVNQTIYIDYTTTGNGTGESEKPIHCISCIDALNLNYVIYHIKGTTKFKDNYFALGKHDHIIIYGDSCVFNNGIYLYECYAEINDCVFEKALYARSSTVNTENCTFNYNYDNEEQQYGAQGAVTMEYSYCRMYNATFNCTSTPYAAIYSTICIAGNPSYSTDMSKGAITNQGSPQPYRQLYYASTETQFDNVKIPEIKQYRFFILEFIDTTDGTIVECMGYISPRNLDQIRFNGTINPDSPSLRNVTGQLNIANGLVCTLPWLHYIKGSAKANTIYLSRIVGVV